MDQPQLDGIAQEDAEQSDDLIGLAWSILGLSFDLFDRASIEGSEWQVVWRVRISSR